MRRNPGLFSLVAVSLVCVLILAACNCPPTLRYITVSPASGVAQGFSGTCTTGTNGDTFQFSALAYYSDGTIQNGTGLVQWSSSTPAVATIAAGGVATAISPGTTTITAAAAGVTAVSTNFTVIPLTTANLTITPGSTSAPLGSSTVPYTLQYALTATATSPSTLTATYTTTATWASSAPTIASFVTAASPGLITTNAVGTTDISATIYCVAAPATTSPNVLTVTAAAPVALIITPATASVPVNGQQQFSVMEVWSDGRPNTGPSNPSSLVFTATSTPTGVASITTAGLATGLVVGTSTIDATETVGPYTISDSSPGGASGTLTVTTAAARFAYVGNVNDYSISEYAINYNSTGSTPVPSGTLTALAKFSVPGYSVQQVVLSPAGTYLYAIGIDANSTITEFAVNSVNGALTNTGNTYPAGGQLQSSNGLIDPTGSYLYVANPADSTIHFFSINQATGQLTSVQTVSTNLGGPTELFYSIAGPYIYALNATTKTVSGYTISTTAATAGQLTPIASGAGGVFTLNAGDTVNFGAIDPTGLFIYIPNGGTGVEGIGVGTGGALSALTGNPFTITGSTFTAGAVVDPTTSYLYVLDDGATSGQIFTSPLTSGVPGAVTGSATPVGQAPMGIVEDNTGSTIIVANNFSNTLSSLGVGSGGVLPSTSNTLEAGVSPEFPAIYYGSAAVAITPSEVVAANAGSGNVAAFTSGSGGALTADTSNPYATFPNDSFVATSSLNNLIITGGQNATMAAAYIATPGTAPTLTAVTGSPFSLGSTAIGNKTIAIDSTGQYILASDSSSGDLYGYTYNGTNILPLGWSPAAVGLQTFAVDPQGTFLYTLASGSITYWQFLSGVPSNNNAQTGGNFAGNWTTAAIDATGQYLVAFDSTAKAVSTFSICPILTGCAHDGLLTFLHKDSVVGNPVSFAFDPTGSYVVVSDATANTVTAYSFTPSSSTAVFTPLTGTAVITLPTTPGGSPGQVSFDASGQYLYVALSGVATSTPPVPGAVAVYTTNVSAGVPAFAAASGSPFPAGTATNGLNTHGVGVTDSVQ